MNKLKFYCYFITMIVINFFIELIELCLVRVEFPNFRGAWYDDNNFISMGRASEDGHGYFLQVRTHKVRLIQSSYILSLINLCISLILTEHQINRLL